LEFFYKESQTNKLKTAASKILFSTVVERGQQKESLTQLSTASTTSSSLMKSSLDLKKCEHKLNIECRSISQKEAEKSKLIEECTQRKNEIASLHTLIRKSNNTRNEIKEELYKIRQQVEKKHDEMNRTKAELLYKTKREYEEMIRRLENEMQFNHRPFSSREEARILHEITSLKHGIILLDSYDEQKRSYDEFKEALTDKKNEQDQIWNQVTEYKKNIIIRMKKSNI